MISFVEGINAKIKSDVQFDAKQVALSIYDQKEKTIVEAGSLVRGGRFEIWSPERGITKYDLFKTNNYSIFSSEAYEDPDGLLQLSIK